MFKFYTYYHHNIHNGDKYVAIQVAKPYDKVDLLNRATDMSIDMYKIYGSWLDENIKSYIIDVEQVWDDEENVVLKSFISFEDEADAMAFKLRWA